MIWVMYLLFVMMRNEFRHTSWFSLDGVSDLGDVTLVIDDDKRIQAHKLVQVLVLFIQSLCIPSSWIQLGSWVGNLFQVLVLLYSF